MQTRSDRDGLTPTELPCGTPELPGTGGLIKDQHVDFRVEEIPRYEPCGEGTHVFFMVEKQGLTTLDAVRRLAQSLKRKPRDFGYAGLKDAIGITRQVFSLEHIELERVSDLSIANLRVLWAKRHTNKLKIGHLAGNRFNVVIRDCCVDALVVAEPILEVLSRCGLPNYFGLQRFGMRGTNADIARAAMGEDWPAAIGLILGKNQAGDPPDVVRARELFDCGDYEGAAAAWPGRYRMEARLCRAVADRGELTVRVFKTVDQKVRQLYYSALQSELFNQVVASRIDALDRIKTGDLAWKHVNGACFKVEDAAVEQPRCDAFEISPSGPMFGAKMSMPSGEPAEIEGRILSQANVSFDSKRSPDGIILQGARRPLRVPVTDLAASEVGGSVSPAIQLTFTLPPGSYATTLLREVTKPGNCRCANPTDP